MSIYVGIDLGTTNSAICTYDGEDVRVWKSPEQNDVTPSVIYNDGRRRYVGKRAYDLAPASPDSTARLFKRIMGTSTPVRLRGAAEPMTPQECSAEVLKTLFGYLPEEVKREVVGTVITVPAAFNQMQKDATLQAAELAGIGAVTLMQEPVAAVMSVMRKRSTDGIFIVYDLGGGTLDVAIADASSGRVSLQAHGGIEMCGGRDWDREIADNVVVPWLREQFELPDSLRTDPTYRPLVSLVEWAAEKAKIELSAQGSSSVSLAETEVRLRDLAGVEIYVDCALDKDQLDSLIEQQINDSVRAVRDAMEKAHIAPHDVNRVVFVGGPTQYKTVRERVAFELGVSGALDVNAMTAVAEGAAVFAESIDWSSEKRGRKSSRGVLSADSLGLTLNYTARTPAGKAKLIVRVAGNVPSGSEFQIDSLDTGWSSGRLSLVDGASVDLTLTKNGENTFRVLALDGGGSPIELPTRDIVISRTAATVDAIPASHSVGLEVLDKVGGQPELEWIVRSGDPLPKRGQLRVVSARSIRAGGAGALIFKLWQGEISAPVTDNLFIGELKITGDNLESGVIAQGEEIICEYEVSDAGTLSMEVSVPGANVTVGSGLNFYSTKEGELNFEDASERVAEAIASLTARVSEMRANIEDDELEVAQSKLDDAEKRGQANDAEGAKAALDRTHEVKRILASVRKRNLPQTRKIDLDSCVKFFNEVCREVAKPSESTQFDNAARSAAQLMDRQGSDFEIQLERMRGINWDVLFRQDWFVIDRFKSLASTPHLFADRAEHVRLVALGHDAIRKDEIAALREILGLMYSIKISSGGDREMLLDSNIVRA
ncbi:Hsp70 family protein [Arenimonas caeni]|uniref:Heat-shock protein Hsp70 n=1 Tax=Arenimonas caeni TaxID=2058085 RepID=A0A2P6M5G2_9GAMM|nr:Hsp70 family protein [Arenimonas caeni]PRH81242.1 heat-shock protein Hsp70 [Arenimonas caeni]